MSGFRQHLRRMCENDSIEEPLPRLPIGFPNYPPEVIRAARASSPAVLQEMVDTYVSEALESLSYYRILMVKDLVIPQLIAVLEREDAFTVFRDPKNGWTATPAGRVLKVLWSCYEPELKRLLLQWFRKKGSDRDVRLAISRHLIEFGSDDLLDEIAPLFEDDDDFISSNVRGALVCHAERMEPRFREFAWNYAHRLLLERKKISGYDPVRILEAIDPERAVKVLSDPALLDPEHPLFNTILGTLVDRGSPPDAAFLHGLLANPGRVCSSVRTDAIKGLIALKDPGARTYVEEILRKPAKHCDSTLISAWDARFRLNGWVPLLDQVNTEVDHNHKNLADLPPELQDLAMIVELNSGLGIYDGFTYWFEQACGGGFGRGAEHALAKIGAKDHARIVAKANRVFGRKGPPLKPELMEKTLASLSKRAFGKLVSLSDQWQNLPSWEPIAYEWDWKQRT